MKRFSIIFIIFCIALPVFAQVTYNHYEKSSQIICQIDTETPHYPGGSAEMVKFIDKNMIIPDSNRTKIMSGKMFIDLAIDTSGNIMRIKIFKGINKYIDNEVLRVFSIMPKWIPAVHDGKKIAKGMFFPIKFDFDKSIDKYVY